MPIGAPRACRCGRVVPSGQRCSACETVRKRQVDMRRPTAARRGYDWKWHRASREFLAQPENQSCACGCGGRSTTVDHKRPHRGDMLLFWDRSNWQGMTERCHNRKTAAQDGGFGNPTRGEPTAPVDFPLGEQAVGAQSRAIFHNSPFGNGR